MKLFGKQALKTAFSFQSMAVVAMALAGMVALQGCQNLQAGSAARHSAEAGKRASRFSPEQIAVLREEGFKETDDGWEFGLNVRILFDIDDDRLCEEARGAISRVGKRLRSVQIEKLRIEGHTDNTGTREYNEQLSLRRAAAVGQVLVAAGFGATDVEAKGLGVSRPIADNSMATGRAENRRVAIVVPAPGDK